MCPLAKVVLLLSFFARKNTFKGNFVKAREQRPGSSGSVVGTTPAEKRWRVQVTLHLSRIRWQLCSGKRKQGPQSLLYLHRILMPIVFHLSSILSPQLLS